MKRWRSYYFLIIPILLLIFFSQQLRLNQLLQSAFFSITRPVFLFGSTIRQGMYSFRNYSGNFFVAVQKQKEYLDKISALERQLDQFREMERENGRLKKLLDFEKPIKSKSVGVRVIAEDASTWKKNVLLDKGSKDGIKKDCVLIAPEGLVGRVLEVTARTSQAILLIDPDFRVSARTTESRAQGVIAGFGTEKVQLRFLSLDSGVSIGEEVTTSGVGSIFPKGILIGVIESIGCDEDGLHLLATVKPSVPFSKLEEMLCLTSIQHE